MKNQNKMRALFLFALTLTIVSVAKAQITCPFPITNQNVNCDVTVGYDVYNSLCNVCDNQPALTIPKNGGVVYVGGPCCPSTIFDIIVTLNQVENCGVVGAPVGEPSTSCDLSPTTGNTNTLATDPHQGHPCTCPNQGFSINYTTSGVFIN